MAVLGAVAAPTSAADAYATCEGYWNVSGRSTGLHPTTHPERFREMCFRRWRRWVGRGGWGGVPGGGGWVGWLVACWFVVARGSDTGTFIVGQCGGIAGSSCGGIAG